ncbi:hypothetical protein [Niallia sp. MER 6]|uniref:hypothetical protein n=1 Tax=Niallia sp. MER 6 TaxID=2939567 RepID=UPI00203C7837|nr:hypothetical protein [Niallia sp. MER 6]MCM3030776.1 hypothetical protein [Niallia sp. MER 6]
MNLYDYLASIFDEKWDKNRLVDYVGQGQHEEVKDVLDKVKTLEEWGQFAAHVATDRGINITEMESYDVAIIFIEELLQED